MYELEQKEDMNYLATMELMDTYRHAINRTIEVINADVSETKVEFILWNLLQEMEKGSK